MRSQDLPQLDQFSVSFHHHFMLKATYSISAILFDPLSKTTIQVILGFNLLTWPWRKWQEENCISWIDRDGLQYLSVFYNEENIFPNYKENLFNQLEDYLPKFLHWCTQDRVGHGGSSSLENLRSFARETFSTGIQASYKLFESSFSLLPSFLSEAIRSTWVSWDLVYLKNLLKLEEDKIWKSDHNAYHLHPIITITVRGTV